MMRRIILLLVVALMALLLVAGPALAASGGNHRGIGEGIGGGNAANPDSGAHTATGGGQLNNKHLCDFC